MRCKMHNEVSRCQVLLRVQRIQRLAICALALASGCASAPRVVAPTVADAELSPSTTRPIESVESRIRFRFVPVRSVASDGFALPMLSPDGCFAAVQISSTADWTTLLASVEGGVPDAGRIAIAPLGDASMSLIDVIGNDLLLGRSADSQGFLVESPRFDGARWIGRVPWQGGEPAWLIADEMVNAFAALGPAGELAWCHRRPDTERFSISLKRGDLIEVIPPPEDGTWMAPSFSSDGKTLFVLRLRDGVLSACAFPIAQTLGSSPIVSTDLSWRADARMAYQTLIPLRTGGEATDLRLYFFHPRFGRMAIWNSSNNRIALASPGSVAVMSVSPYQMLSASAERLSVEPLIVEGSATEAKHATSVIDSLWIPIGRCDGSGVIVVHPRHGFLDISRIELEPASP